LDKLFDNPQVLERNMLVEVEQPGAGRIKIAGNPIKLSDMDAEIPDSPAPYIGQHTKEILSKYLGMTEDQIERLINRSVIEHKEKTS
jgi:CoA:oxalate CoA-transferase